MKIILIDSVPKNESVGGINKVEVTTSGCTADDVLEACVNAMLGGGFHPNSVKNAVCHLAYEYDEADS